MHTGARDVRIGLLVLAAALGCSQETKKAPPPEIDPILPTFVAPGTASLFIGGKSLALDGAQPTTLRIRRIEDLDGHPVTDPDLATEPPLINYDVVAVNFTILDTTPPGIYGVRLVRGDGQSIDAPAFVRLPPPGPATTDVLSLCMNPEPATVGISGSDFLVIGSDVPRVIFKPHQDPSQAGFPDQQLIPKVSGCKRIPFGPEDGGVGAMQLQRCSRLDIELPPDPPVHNLPPQAYEVEIGQPCCYSGSLPSSKVKLILDHPLSFLLDIFRPLSAVDAPHEIDLGVADPHVWWSPPGWHRDEAAPPTATIDGQPIPLVTSGCAPTDVPGHSWCSQVAVTLPQGFPPGAHTLSVTTTPGCINTTHFHNVGRPNVTSVGSPVCTQGRYRFTATGTGFEDPQIFIGGEQLTLLTGCSSPSDLCTLVALPPATLSPGQYPVTIQNNSLPPVMALPSPVVTVASGPPQLGVPEPSVIYGGVDREVAILFNAPSISPITAAGLGQWGGQQINIPTQFTAFDGGVRLVVPAGTPADAYSIVVTEGGVCSGGDPWAPLWVKDDWKVMGDDFDAGIDFADWLEVVWKTVRDSGDPTISATWQATGGNPGGAASFAFDAGMPTWYFGFGLLLGWEGEDLSTLGFDLRLVRSSGAAVTAPDVRILSNGIELQRSLGSSPDGTWKHYVLALDTPAGWTYVDDAGSRPATLTDLRFVRDSAYGLWIRGLYADGAGETWIDNVLVDRHH